MDAIGFDADDTLWENETFFRVTEDDFIRLLGLHGVAEDTARARLTEVELRNLEIYGFGIKGFTLSMIQTALDLTGDTLPGAAIARLLDLGREMLRHPVHLLGGVEAALRALDGRRLLLITKGDVLDQERKIAASGLAPLFERIEIVQHKTPDAYAAILAREGIDPARFLMVGNSVRSDIQPVLAIGGHAALVPHDLTWAAELDDDPDHPRFHRLTGIAEVGALVRRLAGQSSGRAV